MEIKYCENCGAAMPAESKFCTECGTPFPKADKKEAKPAGKPDQLEKTESPLDALMTRPEDSPAFPPENQPELPSDRPAQSPAQIPAERPANYPAGRPAERPADNPPAQNIQNGWNGQPNPAPSGSGGPWNRPENSPFSQNQSVPDPALDSTIIETPPVQNQPIPTVTYGPANTVQSPVGVGGGNGAYDPRRVLYGEDLRGTPLEPISAWGWLGIILLMGIPFVNLVLTIVWACGGCRKNAKKSFARGVLLYVLLGILLTLLFGFLLVTVFINIPAVEDALNEILAQFGYYIV